MRRLLIILITLFLTSCASLEKNRFPENNLSKEDKTIINGTYKNIPDTGGGGFYVRNLVDIFERNRNMFKFNNRKYENKNLKFKLHLISINKINVKIFDENTLLFDENLKINIKNDGFIYLKEKRFMLDGIPFLFGGWNIQKSRFAIDKDNNLYIQSNYFFLNGFLIVFSDWKTLKYEMTFKKQ